MPIITPCTCGKRLRTKDDFVGKRIRCPACGQVLTVAIPVDDLGLADATDEEQDTIELTAEDREGLPRPKDAFWINPHGTDNVIALTETAVYVAALSGPPLADAQARLASGQPVWKVLQEAGTIIAFGEICKVESNLHEERINIHWQAGKASATTVKAVILCPSKPAREEIMEALRDRLGAGWKLEEVEYTRLRALLAAERSLRVGAVLLLACVGLLAAVTWNPVEPQTLGAVVALVALLSLGWVVWLAARLRTPPIMLTLTKKG